MTITQQNRYLDRPAPSSLADVIDTILDKGLVIDIYVRVSLVGIELLTIDARIVIASVDTYLRFAEAVNRLDLTDTQTHGIPELIEGVTESGAKGKTSGAIEGAKEKLGSILGGDDEDSDEDADKDADEDDDEDQGQGRKQPARRTRKSTSRQTKAKED
ncbi:gas vesicle structural protein GvpA [Nocardioides sp. NBC_00368]|uniref:gas vesicle protein GvpJ n=1 Tax=Nocardioides sp. NBC_00368 TaxID=2976000 RepID=UPI002E23E74C